MSESSSYDPLNPGSLPSTTISPPSPTSPNSPINEAEPNALSNEYNPASTPTISTSSISTSSNAPDPDDNKLFSLYIGNLPLNADEEGLRKLFGQYKPGEVRVKQDTTATGNARRYGFVEVTGRSNMNAAIADLDHYEMNGNHIHVSLSNKSGEYVAGGPRRNTDRGYTVARPTGRSGPDRYDRDERREDRRDDAPYPHPQNSKFKTIPCRFYQQGKCEFGNECHYIHDEPQRSGQSNQSNNNNNLVNNNNQPQQNLLNNLLAGNAGLGGNLGGATLGGLNLGLLNDPSALLFSPLLNLPALNQLSNPLGNLNLAGLGSPLATLPTGTPDLTALLSGNNYASLAQSLSQLSPSLLGGLGNTNTNALGNLGAALGQQPLNLPTQQQSLPAQQQYGQGGQAQQAQSNPVSNNYNRNNFSGTNNASNNSNSNYGGSQGSSGGQSSYRGSDYRGDRGNDYRGGGSAGGYDGQYRRGSTGGQPEKFKTVQCKMWPQGLCRFGDNCNFIHGSDDKQAQQPKQNVSNNPNANPLQSQPFQQQLQANLNQFQNMNQYQQQPNQNLPMNPGSYSPPGQYQL